MAETKASGTRIAPNMMHEVQKTINEHPEINTMDELERGKIIDITDRRINPPYDNTGLEPWGRKARRNDPGNPALNTDGMTFKRSDGLFEIYDCISGIDGSATWEGYGPFYQGENGYWWPPQPIEGWVPGPPTTQPPSNSGKDAEQDQRIATLESQVAQLMARPVSIDGKKIALRAAFNDKYLRVRHDQPDKFAEATSDVSQSYEEFYIKDMG